MLLTDGLIAATFTPFHPDGSIHTEMIPVVVEKLVADGLKGIFICGTNGEGPNMTISERMTVAEHFLEAAAGRIKVIVHVGHSSITEARILATHAAAIGSDAISSVSAFYFKPVSTANMVDCMASIAAAAPELPFYYYHIPHLTGVSVDVDDFIRSAGASIPNLAGVKYTATTLHDFQSCHQHWKGRYQMLFGLDEMMLPALSVGASTFIGSTYTFAAPAYLKTIELFRTGQMDAARENHAFLVEMIRVFAKYPPIPAQKAIMKMLGWDFGPTRLPLTTLDAADADRLQRELEAISFFRKVPVRESLSIPSRL
jgi:N-acetylneuraminate lyase